MMIVAPPCGPALSERAEGRAEVVEVSLLLPASRLEGLMNLSRTRGESVAQILRDLIDDALEPAAYAD